MARSLFSIRLPLDLAGALDRIAEHAGQSGSDVVETLITSLGRETRAVMLQTTVAGALTEKRKLRLNTHALARLQQLAGDLERADILRRLLTYALAVAPPREGEPAPALAANGHWPASEPRRRRPHAGPSDGEEGAAARAAGQAGGAGLTALAIVLIGALATLVVWWLWRGVELPPTGPGDEPGGQRPPGPPTTSAP